MCIVSHGISRALLLLLLSGWWLAGPAPTAHAQHPTCDGTRYYAEIADTFLLRADLPYGANTNYAGDSVTLLLDIYEPGGDSATGNRPLVIAAHGGSFLQGSKTDASIRPFLHALARRGYVVASINYRLDDTQHLIEEALFGDANEAAFQMVLRAVHDGKAAVRFLRRSVAEAGNPYRIDTNYITFAGGSAGGILALHMAFFEDFSRYPGLQDTSFLADWGGQEGNSGNPGYSSQVHNLINIAGAIGDTAWITRNDIPLIQLHGDQDLIVPYGDGGLELGAVNVPLQGSSLVHQRLLNLNGWSRLQTWQGAGHVPWATGEQGGEAYLDSALTFSINNLYELTCDAPAPVSRPEPARRFAAELTVYPNPTTGEVNIMGDFRPGQPLQLRVLDLNGRVVQEEELNKPSTHLNLPAGVYIIEVRQGAQVGREKVVLR